MVRSEGDGHWADNQQVLRGDPVTLTVVAEASRRLALSWKKLAARGAGNVSRAQPGTDHRPMHTKCGFSQPGLP
jgi:hypothetical protein